MALPRRILGVAIPAVLASACTIVSGWSDLQTTPASTNGSSSRPDGSATPSGSVTTPPGLGDASPEGTGDASADSSPVTPAGVVCGNTPCTAPEGCCESITSAKSCKSKAACAAGAGALAWYTCKAPRDCAGTPATPVCCYDDYEGTATCQSTCSGTTKTPVCDRTQPSCSGSKVCERAGASSDLYTCF